ncbi:MAG: hypothetical protein IKK43_05505 [Clostridia bacterium]|nr:hypothetical protein [Clostridia bacterium]
MANSKLIIVEGPQGAGKTTITDFIRYRVPYTNLYRLNGISDSTPSGKAKTEEMYKDLLDYMEKMQNKSINLLFDRTFFTEEVYCRLGFKEYSFTDVYEQLLERVSKMDFDIFYITLYLSDEDEFERRLLRAGKADVKYAKFSKDGSINQQNTYLILADEIREKHSNINVVNIDTCIGMDAVKEIIEQLLL